MSKFKLKMLSSVLAFVLLLQSVGVVPVDAATSDLVVWTIYEASLNNNIGMVREGAYTVSDSVDLNTIATGDDISTNYTFVTEDGDYSLVLKSNYNTCSLEGISYNGYDSEVDIELPDQIVVYCVSNVESTKDSESGETSKEATVSKSTYKLTSISSSFDSKCVTTFGNALINLIVTNQITSIDKSAFKGNTNLRSIDFKGDIQTIGESAFENCNGLVSMDLAKTFQGVNNNTIPASCFKNCTQLTNVTIPDSIIHIGKEAFYGCNKLDTISLTSMIETVGKNAFGACSGLRYIYISSKASDWSDIVQSNESYKLITDTDNIQPTVALKGGNNDLNNKYIFGASTIGVFSKVDMASVVVKKDGVVIDNVKEYTDTTYTYKTKGYYFDIAQSDKGIYTVEATDVCGNTCTKSFSYLSDKKDETAPVITLTGKGNNDCYQEVTLNFSDADTYVFSSTLNGSAVESGQVVSTEGSYELIVTDAIDNVAKKSFIIDKTEPTISGVTNGGVYKSGVKITFSDKLSGVNEVILNGVYKDVNGFTVYESGVYNLVVKDKALNTTKVVFTIDSVGPSVIGLVNNKYYNSDVYLDFNSICGVTEAKLTFTDLDDSDITNDVPTGYKCSKNGKYSLKLKDALGNTSSYRFIIDKKVPTVKGVSNNKAYKKASVKITVTDDNISTITLNGEEISKSKTIKDEGKYTLVSKDKAGNQKVVKFTIDRTKPKCTVKKGKSYKKKVKVWGSDKLSGIKSVKLDGKTIKKKTTVKKKGSHKVVITDKAGNKTTVKFKIV